MRDRILWLEKELEAANEQISILTTLNEEQKRLNFETSS
jgi:hypothetical protein